MAEYALVKRSWLARDYDLERDGVRVGALLWRGRLRTVVTAELDGDSWTLTRRSGEVLVTSPAGEEAARFATRRWRREGEAAFGGDVVRWKRLPDSKEWGFERADGVALVRYRKRRGRFAVVTEPSFDQFPDARVLLLLGCYVIVSQTKAAESSAAAATVVTAV